MSQHEYRADIDGLRAVAILSVVIFHAIPTFLTGGFVGVDIFFVISGYLISTILINDLDKKQFSILRFYERRIRRIFPALLAVLSFVLLIAWYAFLTDELSQVAKHIMGGMGFVANLVLWQEVGYFDNAAATKPLLHLWSLGVEEQFYLLWPLLLWLFFKKPKTLLMSIGVCLVLSFSYNIYLSYSQPSSAFYLPLPRFWELLCGSLVAILSVKKESLLINFENNITSLIGVLCIVFALFYVDGQSVFPGWWAFFPVVGASLLIMAGPNAWFNQKVLAHPKMVFVGLISYPLYLVHWPVISVTFILREKPLTFGVAVLLIAISIFLAYLLYRFVERPIRFNKSKKIPVYLLVIGILLVFISWFFWQGKIVPRNHDPEIQYVLDAVQDWDYPPEHFLETKINDVAVFSQKTNLSGFKKVLFIGDSHMAQYARYVSDVLYDYPNEYRSIVFATENGCMPVPGVFSPWVMMTKDNQCKKIRDMYLEYALSPDVDRVVIGAHWYGYLLREARKETQKEQYYYLEKGHKHFFYEGGSERALVDLEKIVRKIAQHKTVYFVLDNPADTAFDPKSFYRGSRLTHLSYGLQKPFRLEENSGMMQLDRRLKKMMTAAGAIVIDSKDGLCPNKLCFTSAEGVPLYKDTNHFRTRFILDFSDFLEVTLMP